MDDQNASPQPDDFATQRFALEKAGRLEELVRLHEDRAREVPPPEAARLLEEASRVASERLKSHKRGEELLRRALLQEPASKSALEGLRRLHEERQDWGAVARTYVRLAALEEGGAAVPLLEQAAALHVNRLEQPDRAALLYLQATRVAPERPEPWTRLRALLRGEGRQEAVLRLIERQLGMTGASAELGVEALEVAEALCEDPTRGETARRALALARELEAPEERIEATQRALDGLDERWSERVRELRARSLDERDRRTAARLSLAVARLYAHYRPEDPTKVDEALDRCFLLWPAMPEALSLLERRAARTGDADALVERLDDLAQRAGQAEIVAEYLVRAGMALMSARGRPEEALLRFIEAASADPSRGDATGLAIDQLLDSGDLDGALELLEKHAEKVREPEERRMVHLRLAELQLKAGRKEGAVALLQRLLEADPFDADAAFRLARIADEDESEDWERLARLSELALHASAPEDERAALCAAVASRFVEHERPREGIELLVQGLRLLSAQAPLIEPLMACTAVAEVEWAELVARAATLAPDPPAETLWRRVGALVGAPPPIARAAWEEILKRHPDDTQARDAMEALGAASTDDARRPDSLASPGSKSLDEDAVRAAVASDPSDLAAGARLAGIEESKGNLDAALALLEALAKEQDGAERRHTRLRQAALLVRLDRGEEAADLYLELLDGDEGGEALGALERLAQQGVRPVELARALAPHYVRSGDSQRHVATLLVQLGAKQAPDERRELLTLLAEVQEKQLADNGAALELRLQILELAPGDAGALEAVLRLARQTHGEVQAARSLAALAADTSDDAVAVELGRRGAELAASTGHPTEAIAALEVAFERSGRIELDSSVTGELRERLLELYAEAGRFGQAETLIRARLGAAADDEAQARRIHVSLVDLLERAGKHGEAAAELSKALEGRDVDDELLERQCRLLEKAGRSVELAEVLGRRTEQAEARGDGEAAAGLALRRARVLESSVGDRAQALQDYARILKQRPFDPDALGGLKTLLENEQTRLEAARALLPAYAAMKEHRKEVALLELIAEDAAEGAERVTALGRAAEIHLRHLRQPELSFGALARAIKLAPADAGLRARAREAAEAAELPEALGEVLEELLERVEGEVALAVRRELADLSEARLGDRPAAISHLTAALELAPERQELMDELQRLLRAEERWEALAGLLERQAGGIPDPARKRALWRETALLHEQRLEDPERAAMSWRLVVERDPRDREAATALERLYAQLDRPRDLAFALELRRGQEGKTAAGRELGLRLANLRRERLDDPSGALQLHQQILQEEPGNDASIAALEAWVLAGDAGAEAAYEVVDPALEGQGAHARRVALREALAEGAYATEQVRLFREMGELQERALGRVDLAFLAAVRAFSAASDAEREPLREWLERLATGADALDALADVYDEVRESASGELATRLLRRSAELREQLGELEEATGLWKALSERLPHDAGVLERLGALYERSKNARSLSDVYTQRARLADDPAERRVLLLDAGRAQQEAGDDEGAIASFQEATALESSVDAYRALEVLYGRTQRPREQAEALGALAPLVEEAERGELLLRRAQLLERSGSAREALDGFAAVLELKPTAGGAIEGLQRLLERDDVAVAAAERLEPALRKTGDRAALADALELRLEAEKEDERFHELGEELAELRASVGQGTQAFATRVRLVRRDPAREAPRERLEALAAQQGALEEVVETYLGMVEENPEAPWALALWRRLAELTPRLDRPQLIARALSEVTNRDPEDDRSLEALGQAHKRLGEHRRLAEVLQRRIARAQSPAARRALREELAELAGTTLLDRELAARSYQEALAEAPDDLELMNALERTLSAAERFDALAELLGRKATLVERRGAEEEALELKVRRARLLSTRLDDADRALAIHREILERRPTHAGAIGALEELSRVAGGVGRRAAELLAPVLAQSGEHLKLVQVLETQAASASSPRERSEHLCQVAELYGGPMDNPDMGFLAAVRALKEDPSSDRALKLCVAQSKEADTSEELAGTLEELCEQVAEASGRARLLRALARLQEAEGDVEEAASSWARLLELEPEDEEATAAAFRVYEQADRGAELLEVLKRQLAAAGTDAERIDVGRRMAELQEREGDASGALTSLRRVLELAPGDEAALERAERLCVELERWTELADILSQRVSRLGEGAPSSVELRFRLGQLKETKLDDRLGAQDTYLSILQSVPSHEGAIAQLERMVERDPRAKEAADALLAAYRATGERARRAALLDARAGVAEAPMERAELLVELGALREEEASEAMAFLAYFRGFKEDPNDRKVQDRLEALAAEAGSEDELVTAYEDAISRVTEADDAIRMSLVAGRVARDGLDEPERAVALFERACSLAAEPPMEALEALDGLYERLERWPELARILAAASSRASTKEKRIELSLRLGDVWQDRLEDEEQAVEAYEAVLAEDPGNLAALRLLEMLHGRGGRPAALIESLERQCEAAEGEERERLFLRMAEVASTQLADEDRAIGYLEKAAAELPRSADVGAALESALERTERIEPLRDHLKARLAVALDPREQVRLAHKLAETSARLGDSDGAIEHYRGALERDPRHRPSLEALRRLLDEAGRSEELVTVLRRLVPLGETPSEVKEVRLSLAETLASLGRREEALDAARRTLEVGPHQVEELDRVEHVFLELGAYPDTVRALELRAEQALELGDQDAAIAALHHVADLWRGPAARKENAAKALERILSIDPARRDAYEQALALYKELEDVRAYAQVIDGYVPHLVSVEEKLEALRELARVQETQLGQKDLAFMALCRALQLDASDPAIREDVERLADATGSHDELAAVYEEVADGLPRGRMAEVLYLALARIQDLRLDEPDEAEASLRKVLEFDPAHAGALEALTAMFARRGLDNRQVVSLEQQVEAAGSIEERKALLTEIARLHDERRGDLDEAASALERAAALDPDVDTLLALAELERRRERWAEVATVLLRARDIAPGTAQQAKLQLEVGQIHETRLDDDEGAISAYQVALEIEPALPEALEALERLYTRLDRPADLLSVYEKQLELSEEVDDKIAPLLKSARIWQEAYENLENADACLDHAWQLDPHNLAVVEGLERVRRESGHWEGLAAALERHIQLAPEAPEQARLHVELGELLLQQLRQPDRAASHFQAALQADPACRPAMHALGGVYERSGNWPYALELMGQEVELLGDSPEAIDLLQRMGRIYEDMLIDTGSARACYERVLSIDPGYLPALRALKGIHEGTQDWEAYEQTLVAEAERTEDPEDRARAMIAVARFHHESRQDSDSARAWYEQALALAPSMYEAARPLADIEMEAEAWEGAERALEVVVAQLAENPAEPEAEGEGSATDRSQQSYRLGYVRDKLGKRAEALEAYREAYNLDATFLPALEALADHLVELGEAEEGVRVYQSILIHHREELTDIEVVDVYWRLGEIHRSLGEPDRARNNLDKALAIEPGHEPSLRTAIELAETANQWELSVEYRQRLVKVLEDEEQLQACLELGALARERLGDAHIALDAYRQAHRLHPGDLRVMDTLYLLYRETRQPGKAAEIARRMLHHPDLKSNPQTAKTVHFALGEIARDELKDVDEAAAAFEAALDCDPRFIDAFSALEGVLSSAKRWKQLEEAYARMIQRLPKTPDTHAARMALWRTLGDLYERVLKHPEGALTAFEVAAAGAPEDTELQLRYARLAAAKPEGVAKAIGAYHRAVLSHPRPQEVGQGLIELYAKQRDYDSAWLTAQAMAHLLGQRGEGEREILQKLTSYARKRQRAERTLDERLWRERVWHPGLRGPLTDVIAAMFQHLGHLSATPLADYQIAPRKHRIDLGSAQEYQVHHYRQAAWTLGLDSVELYSPFLIATRERLARKGRGQAPEPLVGVEACHAHPMCIKVGGRFFGISEEREVRYLLGRALAFVRPELAYAQRLSPDRLEQLLRTVVAVLVPGAPLGRGISDAEKKPLDRALSGPARSLLTQALEQYLPEAKGGDVQRYLVAAELTAARTGVLLAGDLEGVVAHLEAETGAPYRVPLAEKRAELARFMMGPDLHALRQALKLAIEL